MSCVFGRRGGEPTGEVPELALTADAAATGFRDAAKERQNRGDRAHRALT